MINATQLRWMSTWLLVGWLLVFSVVVLSLIPPIPSDTVPLFILPYADKIAHFIAYFTLMSWFTQIYRESSQRIYFAWGFLFLGIMIEILQGLSGLREEDWKDVVANSSGILCAYLLSKTAFSRLFVWIENKMASHYC